MYADWWYLWAFLYFVDEHKDVFIVLKKSLKWAPLVGWVSMVLGLTGPVLTAVL